VYEGQGTLTGASSNAALPVFKRLSNLDIPLDVENITDRQPLALEEFLELQKEIFIVKTDRAA
jgi:hypothetical protein